MKRMTDRNAVTHSSAVKYSAVRAVDGYADC
jgi:hypothetical protein